MRSKIIGLALLAMLANTGCQSYSPYGYGYGGSYSTPPAGAYVPAGPPGTVMTPRGQPYPPPGNYPPAGNFPPPNGYPPTTNWQQPRNLTMPPGKITEVPLQQQPPPSGPPNQRLVPGYRDPNGGPNSLGSPLTDPDDEDFKPGKKPVGMRTPSGVHLDSITDDSEENLSAFGDEKFADPVPFRPASSTTTIDEATRQTAHSIPNPYSHDTKGYTWLRGKVDYDERDKAWHITYSQQPLGQDTYGGSLTLMDDEKLDALLANDVVLVEGGIDTARRDRFGKPMYRVQRVLRLVPKNG